MLLRSLVALCEDPPNIFVGYPSNLVRWRELHEVAAIDSCNVSVCARLLFVVSIYYPRYSTRAIDESGINPPTRKRSLAQSIRPLFPSPLMS